MIKYCQSNRNGMMNNKNKIQSTNNSIYFVEFVQKEKKNNQNVWFTRNDKFSFTNHSIMCTQKIIRTNSIFMILDFIFLFSIQFILVLEFRRVHEHQNCVSKLIENYNNIKNCHLSIAFHLSKYILYFFKTKIFQPQFNEILIYNDSACHVFMCQKIHFNIVFNFCTNTKTQMSLVT